MSTSHTQAQRAMRAAIGEANNRAIRNAARRAHRAHAVRSIVRYTIALALAFAGLTAYVFVVKCAAALVHNTH